MQCSLSIVVDGRQKVKSRGHRGTKSLSCPLSRPRQGELAWADPWLGTPNSKAYLEVGPSVPRSARSVTPGRYPSFCRDWGEPPVGTLPGNSHVIQSSMLSLPGTAIWAGVAVLPDLGLSRTLGQLPVPTIVAGVGTVPHLNSVFMYTSLSCESRLAHIDSPS